MVEIETTPSSVGLPAAIAPLLRQAKRYGEVH